MPLPHTSCGVWIERHPPETTHVAPETFELVVFSSYEIKERASYIGEASLKRITRGMVEGLVGREG